MMRRLILLVALGLAAGPAAALDAGAYLLPEQTRPLLRQIPQPPATGSAADKADRAAYAKATGGIGNAVWVRAAGQLSVNAASYRQQLSCALGVAIGEKATPRTMAMLARAGKDAAGVVGTAKDYFQRPRPFTTDNGPSCDRRSAVNGGASLGYAYPSGHATTGQLWGLILADALPGRRAAALAFGKETGDLRVACRVHWASDVAAGQQLAGTLYRMIAATPAYRTDVEAARAELAAAPPPRNC